MQDSRNTVAQFEQLEGRTLLAGITLSEVAFGDGTQLVIDGTSRADRIGVKQTANGLLVTSRSWSTIAGGTYNSIQIRGGAGADRITVDGSVTLDTIIYGDAGNDTIIGGSGNDRIYGGAGNDKLSGGAGDDTLVAILGGGRDRLIGGEGSDTFWMDSTKREFSDATADEIVAGQVHAIGAFFGKTSNKLGADLADPTLTRSDLSYRNFSSSPLFAAGGPSADDVNQGYLGDCYFLAVLSSMANVDADSIRQTVVDVGDGTYVVEFWKFGAPTYIRVDGDLPTWNWGAAAYADLGAEGSTWVGIVEKAFAFFRRGQGSYASIEGGWMSESYSAMGFASKSLYWAESADAMTEWLKTELAANKSVTFATDYSVSSALLVGGHAYSVDRIEKNDDGELMIVVRNPWGVDGKTVQGANDGYISLSVAQAFAAFIGMTSAAV